jgi:predicted Rossmann fold flavoprotein
LQSGGKNTVKQVEIAVVGGGASGLMAAASAAAFCAGGGHAPRVAVLEKNDRVGKKLLATGNGRCNLTNLRAEPSRYHGDTDRCAQVLRQCPPQKILDVFAQMGLFCRELEGGRVYPYSLQGSSVLNLLRRRLESLGVETICDFPVTDVKKTKNGFLVASGEESISTQRVIFCSGGKAGPQFGTDGSIFPVLKSLGHSVTPLRPALVPVKSKPERLRPLKGVRCPAKATFLTHGKQVAFTEGEVQFTDTALSGICIFELARCAGASGDGEEISLDLAPETAEEQLAERLRRMEEVFPGLPPAQLLEGMLHRALAVEVVRQAEAGGRAVFSGIARAVKDFRFPILGTLSWPQAQVTAGGVPIGETDENFLSKSCKGVYLCGELLDVDGDCGGFNLHWAWATGLAAGEAAAKSVGKGNPSV